MTVDEVVMVMTGDGGLGGDGGGEDSGYDGGNCVVEAVAAAMAAAVSVFGPHTDCSSYHLRFLCGFGSLSCGNEDPQERQRERESERRRVNRKVKEE